MKTKSININENVFTTLIAKSADEQEQGLMYVPPPAPVMSFVYSSPQTVKFWMKNTPAPLDIVFVCKGQVTQIHEGVPYSTQSIGDDLESDLVVELPRGLAKKCNIKIGDSVSFID